MKKQYRGAWIYPLMLLLIFVIVFAMRGMESEQTAIPYTWANLFSDLENDLIDNVEVTLDSEIHNAGRAKIQFKNLYLSDEYIEIPAVDVFMNYMQEHSDVLRTASLPRTGLLFQYIPFVIMIVIFVFLMFFIFQHSQGGSGSGGGSKVMSFGKSKAKMAVDDKNKVTFDNVAGLQEEKHDLQEIVDFLKQPKKFIDIGARIPKGVLLVGPPGTGKTLLAKAVSGEASVPFFSISGSDFVEMFVGVGASRVRDLFSEAKKNSPCIIFIDEIDAVGRRRGAGLGGGHDEREQTLNQLLVEMDGFGINEGVIVLAATNRSDILDPALLRPGRFDRRVVVGRPDVKAREEILAVHTKKKTMASDIDLTVVAKTTAGFTGADLENLMNEAALLAVRSGKKEVDMKEISKAFVKVGIGTEKKSRVITEKVKRLTAYHEAGHAIIHELLDEIDPVQLISIIPTGMAGGYTMTLPEDEEGNMSKKYMEQEITALLGGRAAEELIIKDITTGASSDIERATNIARSMVTRYGMSEILGPMQFGEDNNEVFLGRDISNGRNYGENIASQIDSEIKRFIDTGYQQALDILNEYMDLLHKTAEVLMEKEKMTGEEFRALFPEGVLKNNIDRSKFINIDIVVNDDTEEKVEENNK